MHKINIWGLMGTLLLALFIFLGALHYLCGDDLLFQSDLYSLFIYLGGATLVSAPVILLPVVLVRFVPRLGSLLDQAILLTFAFILLVSFEVLVWKNVFNATLRYYHLIPMVILSAVGVFFGADRETLLKRTEKLGLAGLVLLGLGIPVCISGNHVRGYFSQASTSEGKHLVYIVLDAFPAQYLQAYNPVATPTSMDQALADSSIYKGVTTTTPYTNSYFGTFYSGKLDPKNPETKSPLPEGNLFAELQERGVSTRWISFHRNGYPECCAAAVHDYKGLRSYFLTENLSWIPKALGMNYHVTLNRPPPKDAKGRQKRRYALSLWLNGERSTDFDNVFTDCLIPQMREMRKQGSNTLTLFHYAWYSVGASDESTKVTGAQETDGESQDGFLAKARENGYRYNPEDEPQAEVARQHNRESMEVVGKKYQKFLDQLRSDPELKDATVILTADHGSMYGKGRCFYGYHPNQEVIQVLCAVSEPEQRPAVDERVFSTPDMTASVLDFFGHFSAFNGEAHSIFQDGPGREHTFTLTQSSEKWKEWWLVIIENGKKHWININPDGQGETISYPLGDYDENPLPAETAAADQEKRSKLISEALDSFGVREESIHVSFRGKNLK